MESVTTMYDKPQSDLELIQAMLDPDSSTLLESELRQERGVMTRRVYPGGKKGGGKDTTPPHPASRPRLTVRYQTHGNTALPALVLTSTSAALS